MNRLLVLWQELSSYDVIYLQGEALPFLPFFLERRMFNAGPPVIVDYDDAIYANYTYGSNAVLRLLLGSKIPSVVKHSAHVVVANQELANWAQQFNSSISLIPTSVDLSKYPHNPPDPATTDGFPQIVWIGTPITARYLHLLDTPLRILSTRYDFVLKVIGAPDFRMDGVNLNRLLWDETTEANELAACVAGVMPLSDSAWERGKSALKLIQYLAAGIVGVASPVGANCDVVQDGENGLLAATDEEWIGKLSLILENSLLRQRLASAGRQTVEAHYSVQANAPKWIDLLQSVG